MITDKIDIGPAAEPSADTEAFVCYKLLCVVIDSELLMVIFIVYSLS